MEPEPPPFLLFHQKFTLTPPTISGSVKQAEREYKYEAEIELKVDVIWHPKPRGVVNEPVRIPVPVQQQNQQFAYYEEDTIDWQKIGQETKKVIVVVTLSLAAAAAAVAAAMASGLFGLGASLDQPDKTKIAFTYPINFSEQNENA